MTVRLTPGKFYKAKDGAIWCCYRVREELPEHAQAQCVQVEGERIEYFYVDGRYDGSGKREHTLVEEVGGADGKPGTVSGELLELIERLEKLPALNMTPRHLLGDVGTAIVRIARAVANEEISRREVEASRIAASRR